MKMRSMCVAAALLAAGPAWAGQYDQPYGLIEAGYVSKTKNEDTVALSRIDGQSLKNPRRPDPVAPGKHTVDVSYTTARIAVGNQLQTIEIDVQPCKRYRVAAHYESPSSSTWKPVVQYVEDIGECKKKFMKTAPAK